MNAAQVQTLIDNVPCDLCNAPPGLAWYLVLAALLDVANGEPVPSDTQTLITEANCLLCLVPPGLVPYLMIQAIRGISTGGGTGGAGGVYRGIGDPNGVVTSTTTAALYYDESSGAFWDFTGVANTNTGWVELLAA